MPARTPPRERTSISPACVPGWARRALLVLTLCVASVATPRSAMAHAHLVRSAPAAGATLAFQLDRIRLWFSEAVAPVMTRIVVTTPAGARVSVTSVQVSDSNPLLAEGTLRSSLGSGHYRVEWSTVAQDDGHPSHGSFEFTVATTASTAGAATGSLNAVRPVTVKPQDSGATGDSTREISVRALDLESPLYIVARTLNFAALVTLLGVVSLRLLVIPAVVRGDVSGQSAAFEPVAARAGARLGLLAGIASLLASLGRLRAEFTVVGTEASVSSLLQTTWGHVWLAQMILSLLACISFALAASTDGPLRRTAAWVVASTAVVLMAATPALSGHAVAVQDYKVVSVALDVIHVLAAGGWLGGLLAIALAGVPAAMFVSSDSGLGGGLPLIARIVNAFSPTALAFATCVMVTGGIAAWLRIGSLSMLLGSAYGEALLIKLAFVAIVLAGGAYNWLRMRRSLVRYESETAAIITFRRTAWLELMAGLLVIFATAVLVALSPPMG